MRYIFFCFIAIATMGCRAGQKTQNCRSLKDSLVMLVQRGTLEEDTVLLKKVIILSDSLLSIDTTALNRMFCYHHRAIAFYALGNVEEAAKNVQLEMLYHAENNPERLLFLATKFRKENKNDSAERYLDKMITVCKKLQENGENENTEVYMIKALYLRCGDECAKKYLLQVLKKHPKSQLLIYIKDNWYSFINSAYHGT